VYLQGVRLALFQILVLPQESIQVSRYSFLPSGLMVLEQAPVLSLTDHSILKFMKERSCDDQKGKNLEKLPPMGPHHRKKSGEQNDDTTKPADWFRMARMGVSLLVRMPTHVTLGFPLDEGFPLDKGFHLCLLGSGADACGERSMFVPPRMGGNLL